MRLSSIVLSFYFFELSLGGSTYVSMLPHVHDVNFFVGSSGGENALGGETARQTKACSLGQPFLRADDNLHENTLTSTSVTKGSLIRCYGRGETCCGFVSLQLGNFDPTRRPHRAQPQLFWLLSG
jgi:hypothetical protein